MKPERLPKLSAIVPVNNYFQHRSNIEKIIHDCVSLEIELILVLDRQSSEASEDLRALFKKSDGYGLVIACDSGNPGGARNAGLICATAEWITFWDCDDEPRVSKIFEMILSSSEAKNQVLVGSFQIKSLEGETSTIRILDLNNWDIDLGLNPGIWRFVFRKDLIEDTRFPDARMGEDQIFLQRVISKEPDVLISHIVTYVYRTNVPNQLTSELVSLKDLVGINIIATQEFKPRTKYSRISKTMIIRQLLTLSKSESMEPLVRLTYFARAIILLAGDPKILFRLVKLTFEKIPK
jgi:glycosyltransferase involved in cell wall biosynthesis